MSITTRSGWTRAVDAMSKEGGNVHRRLCDAMDQAQVDAVVAEVARIRPHRHPGQRRRRQHHHCEAVGGRGGTLAGRLAAGHQFQSERHVPVHPCRRAGHEAQKSGKIVNLASIAGRGLSVASGARLCRGEGRYHRVHPKLSYELGPFGININAIAPSLTLTERIRPQWNQRSPEAQAAQIESTPLRRVAEASDQAKVIASWRPPTRIL